MFIFVALLARTPEDKELEFGETVFLVDWNAVLGTLDFYELLSFGNLMFLGNSVLLEFFFWLLDVELIEIISDELVVARGFLVVVVNTQ